MAVNSLNVSTKAIRMHVYQCVCVQQIYIRCVYRKLVTLCVRACVCVCVCCVSSTHNNALQAHTAHTHLPTDPLCRRSSGLERDPPSGTERTHHLQLRMVHGDRNGGDTPISRAAGVATAGVGVARGGDVEAGGGVVVVETVVGGVCVRGVRGGRGCLSLCAWLESGR